MASPKPEPQKTPIHLLDGGLGTTLADVYGCEFNSASTPLWSSSLLLSSPSTLLAAQTSFTRAGADLLLTDTYQTSFMGFLAEGCASRDVAAQKMCSAVGIAHQAFADAGRKHSDGEGEGEGKGKGKVVLGLGAYGATMVPGQEYTGNYDIADAHKLREWHAERIDVFGDVHERVDMLAFETIPLLREIEVLREAMTGSDLDSPSAAELRKKRFWISCVFPNQEKERENLLPDGSSISQVVAALLGDTPTPRRRPEFVGINCTKMARLPGLILEFEQEISSLFSSSQHMQNEKVGLVIYPDGTNGEVYNTTTQEWEIREPREGEKEERAKSWDERIWEVVEQTRERGFWREIIVGGCCKTTPPDIERLRKRIDDDALVLGDGI